MPRSRDESGVEAGCISTETLRAMGSRKPASSKGLGMDRRVLTWSRKQAEARREGQDFLLELLDGLDPGSID